MDLYGLFRILSKSLEPLNTDLWEFLAKKGIDFEFVSLTSFLYMYVGLVYLFVTNSREIDQGVFFSGLSTAKLADLS